MQLIDDIGLDHVLDTPMHVATSVEASLTTANPYATLPSEIQDPDLRK